MIKDLRNQGLTSLDNIDLTGVTELYCSHNQLKELPVLPHSLELLDCDNNQLKELPVLPDSLKELYCSNNQLKELPVLPDSLKVLFCSNNQLKELPVLPDSLKGLYCIENQLKELPVLPDSLEYLYCSNNQLKELPDIIPWEIKIFGIEYNKLEYINTKRKWLGLKEVKEIPNKEEWDEINREYIKFLYRPDGKKFKQAEKEFYSFSTSETSA
jgi:Leucine-rich repeat (LRR) protein